MARGELGVRVAGRKAESRVVAMPDLEALRARLEGLEEEVARLAHVASVWDLVRAAMERRVVARRARTISRASGVRLTGVKAPRRLRERRG